MAFFKKFGEKIKSLFTGRKVDESFFEELEDTLLEGDLGSRITDEVITELREECRREKISDSGELREKMKRILSAYIEEYDLSKLDSDSLKVWMIMGVNGVGKTTTIAKMGRYFEKRGERVLLAAADTFRAAAVDQLEIHAERLNMRIVKQRTGADPGAVVFDAITSAQAQNDSFILIDTAGRMHNKENLMKELQKMDKIIRAKGLDGEHYQKFLVIDATTGQNGFSQASMFKDAAGLDGVILTKYDSAAKGGTLIQIGKFLRLPVAFVCTGEKYDDIHPFDKEEFLESLLGSEG